MPSEHGSKEQVGNELGSARQEKVEKGKKEVRFWKKIVGGGGHAGKGGVEGPAQKKSWAKGNQKTQPWDADLQKECCTGVVGLLALVTKKIKKTSKAPGFKENKKKDRSGSECWCHQEASADIIQKVPCRQGTAMKKRSIRLGSRPGGRKQKNAEGQKRKVGAEHGDVTKGGKLKRRTKKKKVVGFHQGTGHETHSNKVVGVPIL